MANPRLFWRFPSDAAATIAASTEGSQGEVENLLYSDLDSCWITTGAGTAETVTLDLGSAQSISAFALLGHDFTGTETAVQICGNSANSWASPAFTHDCTYRADNLVEFFAVKSYRYWRFRFTKANATDIRSAGRLLLGPYYELTRGLRQDSLEVGSDDLSETRVTQGGQRFADIRASFGKLSCGFVGLDDTDTAELRTLARTYGRHTPWILSVDHDHHPADLMLYGVLEDMVSTKGRTWAYGHLWDFDVSLAEAL